MPTCPRRPPSRPVALNGTFALPGVGVTCVRIGDNPIGVADGFGASFTAAADQVGTPGTPLDP